MKFVSILVFFLILFQSCRDKGCNQEFTPTSIMTVPGSNNGVKCYYHIILVDDYDPRCLDSVIAMSLASKYLNEVKDAQPAEAIAIFNKVEYFDPGENLSQKKAFWGNCMVEITFDVKTSLPAKFTFYDRKGNVSRESIAWKEYD